MAVVGVSACSDDNNGLDIPQEQHPEAGYITLNLNCVEGTRVTEEEGVTDYNENVIRTVTICLWANDGTKPDATAKPDYVQTFSAVNEQNTATLRIPLTEPLKKVLFESDPAKCNVFAAVNVTPPTGEFTIAEFRNMAIGSTFSSQRLQNSFAMDGDSEVHYNRATNVATGTIPLQRSASKLTLALSVDPQVEQSVVVDGELITSKWKPDTKNMRVWINGALSESQLDPDMNDTPSQGYFFNTPDNLTYTFEENTENPHKTDKFTYDNEQDMPFYTYPHRWSAEPGDYAATYMTLAIPWMRVNDDGSQVAGSSWRTCYYQVPVISENSEVLELVRNVAYHVYLHVGLLGSFVPDEPLLLENLEYSAAEWGNVNMDVNIPDVRYLVVDQNDYTVNNETSIVIPFYTSHETVVTDATMTFYRYNYDDVGRELPVVVTMAKNEESAQANRAGAPVFTAYFNNETKELEVSHELVMYEGLTSGNTPVSFTNNDGPDVGKAERLPRTEAQWNALMNTISYFRKVQPTTTMTDVNEYSRVEFKITLQHKDINQNQPGSHNFEEVITITQYPGMYITTVQNYCPTTSTTFTYSGAQGNTFVNGNYESKSGNSQDRPSGGISDGWMTSIGLSTGFYNFNPNLYLVTVTTLPEGTLYRIGNPRSSEINNDLGSGVTNDVNGKLPTNKISNAWEATTYTYSGNRTVRVNGFATGQAIYSDNDANKLNGVNRTLSYYYPTLEDDEHKMMIAPKFRICSSYAGTTWILNRELARRRAAAFQELGYAAGRWRLPTFGEVAFVMQLAADFKIPRLFGGNEDTWYYWCANGLVQVPAKNNTRLTKPTLPGESGFVGPVGGYPNQNPWVQRARFVYDEWYWGDADLKANGVVTTTTRYPVYTFTWGDRPL